MLSRSRVFLLAAAAIASPLWTAAAADLPVRAPAVAPAPAPLATTWTGFYIGGHLGWAEHDGNMTAFTPFNGFAGFPVTGLASSGLAGGLQAGYNYQMGSIVIGLEGDVTAASLQARSNNSLPGTWWSSGANWFGAIGPRVGFAFGDALIYAKGGVAIADFDYSHNQGGNTISAGSTRTGWMIGGGLEYAINRNFSVKAEYNFMDFGSGRTTIVGAPTIFVEPKREIQVVKFGFNYRFGGSAAPVVAKY